MTKTLRHKNKLYNKAINQVKEYSSIDNIVKNLRDMEKFKRIILSKDQIDSMYFMSKPKIFEQNKISKKDANLIALDESKSKASSVINYYLNKEKIDKDCIDYKILSEFDPEILSNLNRFIDS